MWSTINTCMQVDDSPVIIEHAYTQAHTHTHTHTHALTHLNSLNGLAAARKIRLLLASSRIKSRLAKTSTESILYQVINNKLKIVQTNYLSDRTLNFLLTYSKLFCSSCEVPCR